MPKTESFSRPAYAEIHVENFLHNLRYLRSLAKHPFFCPMLKANAYGHGDVELAKVLQTEGIDHVGVATLDEAIHLRQGGYSKNILVFAASFQSTKSEVIKYKLTPVLSEIHHLEVFNNLSKPIGVHVKLNTGMNRMGFDENQIEAVKKACRLQNLRIDGLLTHLYCGSDLDEAKSVSQKQIAVFEHLAKRDFSDVKLRHVYNSDALLSEKHSEKFGARPGIALYGYSEKFDVSLKPVMHLKVKVAAIRNLTKGQVVSYGATWKATKNRTIAVLPIGYADGIARILSNQIEFSFAGTKLPQVGTICMDYTMADVSQVKDKIKVGSIVEIISDQKGQTAKDMAEKMSTIPYEVLTAISERVPRFFVGI